MLVLKNQPSNKNTKSKSGKAVGKVTSYAKDPQETTKPAQSLNKKQTSAPTTKQQTTSSHSTSTKASIPISDITGNRGLVSQTSKPAGNGNTNGSKNIPISDITGSRGLVSQSSKPAGNGNTNGSKNIPISDITGSRGLVSQKPVQTEQKDESKGTTPTKAPYIPISVVTGSRNITTVSPQLRAYLQKDSPSAMNAIPKEYADLANVLEKMGSEIDLSNWARMTTKQQLALAQKICLSDQDQQTLLNTAPHYVETIREIQDVFANRYDLGITLNDARNVANDLFEIANERNEAISRTGKYQNDAVFAPKALRWLDEKEEKILKNLQENTNEAGQATWYNGGNSESSDSNDNAESSSNKKTIGYMEVPGQGYIGATSNNATVNCYGYILMTLGIETTDGNYDIQPGMLSETRQGDHAHIMVGDELLNRDLETITDFVIRDLEQTGKSAQEINSYTDATESEVVIAIKTTNPNSLMPDYHCAILLSDGSWADKPGIRKGSRQGVIKNADESWGTWWNPYNSETIYIAVAQP